MQEAVDGANPGGGSWLAGRGIGGPSAMDDLKNPEYSAGQVLGAKTSRVA
ncbi:MAG: hypothetical protein V3S51_01390 [Dehalococcoidia bacterium]